MKVLFWNTQKNNKINSILQELIIEQNVSIVVLAEYSDDIEMLTNNLSQCGKKMDIYCTLGCDRIKILGNIKNIEPGNQSKYASIQIINSKDILCCVHLPSKIYSQSDDFRSIIVREIVSDLLQLEKEIGIDNSIVVGDFNVNPYESVCIGSPHFHAMPVYKDTKKKSRKVAGQEFFMFYNPMWNFLGDFNSPYGTYYYNGSNVNNTYWNIFDQVIIRPSLRDRFVDENLKIITETKTTYLLDENGHPNKKISDHLPIMFEIKEDI